MSSVLEDGVPFNFVIAHPWPSSTQLGAYSYLGETQYGTPAEARSMLAYAKEQSPKWDWGIYVIDSKACRYE